MKNKKYFNKVNDVIGSDITTICLIIVLFSIIYSFIGFQKHNHFQTFGWDTAVFDQQLFLVSQLKIPISSLHGFVGLGDHFHPLLYIFGGLLYKIWGKAEMLYIIQSTVASLSALPLYLIAKRILIKTKFSGYQIKILSLLICIVYLLNVSFQFMVLGEYNDAPTVALPLLFSIYFLLTRNNLGYWVSFVFILLTKEEYTLFAIPLALYIAVIGEGLKKAFVNIILGLGTFFLLTYLIMPSISAKKEYLFFTNSNRPPDVILKMVRDPSQFLTKLFDNYNKRKTILISLASDGFLPLLSPTNLILPLGNLAIRFYDDSIPRRFEFNNQYAAGLIPPLAVAQSFGVLNLIIFLTKRCVNKKKIFFSLASFILLITLMQDIVFHAPINSLFKKQFYEHPAWIKDAHELISQVPKDVTIAANNSLLPHLSGRENFYLLPKIGNAEYIVVDLADGPNKFAPLVSSKEMERVINNLIREKKYKIIWQKGKSMLLQKQPISNQF